MEMSNKEIVRRYQDADSKRRIVEILADLNATTPKDIRDILISEGVMKKSGPKGPRKLKAVMPQEVKSSNCGSMPIALRDAAHLGIELINIRIKDKEEEIENAQKALNDLKKQRSEMLKAIHSVHPDNDGNLWYYTDNGKAVIVDE